LIKLYHLVNHVARPVPACLSKLRRLPVAVLRPSCTRVFLSSGRGGFRVGRVADYNLKCRPLYG